MNLGNCPSILAECSEESCAKNHKDKKENDVIPLITLGYKEILKEKKNKLKKNIAYIKTIKTIELILVVTRMVLQ